MNPFQSDNIWKKKARQGKAQQHPLTPRQEWQKQVNSSSLWLGGGVVLLALYLAAVRTGTVALDASAVVLIVVVGCFCVYTAASLGRLMKNTFPGHNRTAKRIGEINAAVLRRRLTISGNEVIIIKYMGAFWEPLLKI